MSCIGFEVVEIRAEIRVLQLEINVLSKLIDI